MINILTTCNPRKKIVPSEHETMKRRIETDVTSFLFCKTSEGSSMSMEYENRLTVVEKCKSLNSKISISTNEIKSTLNMYQIIEII